jgi:hypothetical protein
VPDPRPRRPVPHVLVLALGLGASAVFLLVLGRHLYFFGDEWDPLLHRGLHLGGRDGILYPHNEHWTTIPIVLYRLLWNLVGLDHYAAYLLMPVGALMALCVALYVLLRRTGVAPWPAVVASLILGWGGFGEDTLWAFQVGFLGAVAFGVLAVLAVHSVDQPVPRAVIGGALTVAALMCSGLGLPMVAWVGCFALLRRGWLSALATAGPPAAVYVVWYAAYGGEGNPQGLPDASSGAILAYTWAGLANIWNATTGVPGVGGVIFLVLLGVALFVRVQPALHALAVSGFVAAFGGYGVIAFSRAVQGPEQALSSRYVPMGLALTLPAFAIALGLLAERLPARRAERVAIPVVLTVLLAATGVTGTLSYYRMRENPPDLDEQVLAAVALTRSGEPLLSPSLPAPNQPNIDVPLLASPEIRDHLPDGTPDDQTMLDVRAQMQADVALEPGDMPFASSVTGSGLGGDLDLSSCQEPATMAAPDGYVEIPGQDAGVQVGLVVPTDAVQIRLVRGKLVSAPITHPVGVGQTVFVRTVASNTALRVSFNASTFGICRGQE